LVNPKTRMNPNMRLEMRKDVMGYFSAAILNSDLFP